MKRRCFFGAIASSSLLGFSSCVSASKTGKNLSEQAQFDVVVVGGGTAGTVAAIQSARLGAKTLIIERTSQLGGTTTTAGVNFPGLFHIDGEQVISGIGWELVCKTIAEGGDTLPEFKKRKEHWLNQVKLNEYLYACIAEEEFINAGGTILYYSYPHSVEKVPDGYRIFVASNFGEGYISTNKIIDCTGSASVAALAGFKRLSSKRRQPGTLIFQMSGFNPNEIDERLLRKAFKEGAKTGEVGNRDIWNFGGLIRENGFNSIYVPNADSSNVVNFSLTNVNGRKVLLRVFRFLKKQKGFENVKIDSIKTEVGVRETYRILGETIIKAEEYRAGMLYSDSVCYSYYPTDLHDTAGLETIQQKTGIKPTIPLSALIPKGADNMMVAGRCVSSDRLANSALRVQASCMAMGQVAGCVSALAARAKTSNKSLSISEIKEALLAHKAIVP